MKKYKPIKFSEDFVFDDNKLDYVFKVKKRSYLWLWLLLVALFFGLCCVRCNHDITVHVVDHVTQEPITPTSVTLEYTEHALCKGGSIFYSNAYSQTLETDENGDVVFEDMPCSVFSYIFYAFSDADYTVENGCSVLTESPTSGLFHYKWKQTLKLAPKTTEIILTVIDRETEEPLADAFLQYTYIKGGKTINDSIKTDASGRCNIADVPICGNINISRASCYAYEDTTNISIAVIEAISDDDVAAIALTPVKESFTFFVQNKFTHQPIPNAKVEVVLKNKNNVVRHGPISTNVDGTGRGAYNDAFIGATLELRASKTNYKDSIYTPVCTVKEFIVMPDSLRVIYLEPLPYNQTFVNADSISHEPIAGIMNHIVVKSIDGKEYTYDEPSNRQGVFTFKSMEGDHIVIDSKLDPQYETKHTEIAKFEEGDTIFMKPRVTDITFRTIIAGTQTLLPNCELYIYDSNDNNYKPDNSGNGEFVLKGVPLDAEISIIATKDRYGENDYTIDHLKVAYLIQAPQNERDIPLVEGLEPCNASNSGASDVKAGTVSQPQSYNMGRKHGIFDLSWSNGGSCPDKIDVYNHEPGESYNLRSPIFTTGMTAGDGASSIRFSNGSVITIVVITGPSDGSSWEYKLGCPK